MFNKHLIKDCFVCTRQCSKCFSQVTITPRSGAVMLSPLQMGKQRPREVEQAQGCARALLGTSVLCHLLQPLCHEVTAPDHTWHLQPIPPSNESPAPRTHTSSPGVEPDLVTTTEMISLPGFPGVLALPWPESNVREHRRVRETQTAS